MSLSNNVSYKHIFNIIEIENILFIVYSVKAVINNLKFVLNVRFLNKCITLNIEYQNV